MLARAKTHASARPRHGDEIIIDMILFLYALATMLYALWFATIIALVADRWIGKGATACKVLVWLYHEIKVLYLVALVSGPLLEANLLTAGHLSTMDYVRIAVGPVAWHWVNEIIGDDDDHRWRRRRKKIADKVAQMGGRLVVVPARR